MMKSSGEAGPNLIAPPSSAWDNVLGAAMRLPGIRVDRAAYLKSALGIYIEAPMLEKAIRTTPFRAGVSALVIDDAARSAIAWHRAGVSATSFAAGLPGGWAMAATIPADVAQYFGHVVTIIQKLAYLYGWPSLLDEENQLDESTRLTVTLFVGVMMGSEAANGALGVLAKGVADQVVRRLPRVALTKYALYNVAKEVAKWIGVKLTKETLAKSLAKVVPILGGVLSGALSWVTFSYMAETLRVHLASLPLAARLKSDS